MYRSFLSWRWLWARRTNLIAIVGILVGVGALILILSIMTGFLDESRRGIRGSLSDVVITPEHLPRPEQDPREVPLDPTRLLQVVRSDPRVAAASAHLVYAGMLTKVGSQQDFSERVLASSQNGDLPLVQLVGIDLSDDTAATDLQAALERESPKGENVADPAQPFALPPEYRRRSSRPISTILVGEQLMYHMRLARGEVVNLYTLTPDPKSGEFQPSNRNYVVAGSFRSRENEMDLNRVYLQREELADLIQSPRLFSEVLVKLKDYDRDAQAFSREISHGLSVLGLLRGKRSEVRTWEEFRGSLIGAIENERVLIGIVVSLVLVVASFTVFAILSMMVSEKRRDIGILTALGATPRGILGLFLLIAFWDALLGAFLGAVLGVWGALKIDPLERWLSSTFGVEIFNREVYLFDYIPSRVETSAVAAIVLAAFVSALVFAMLPSYRAARLDPLEALRSE